VEEALIKSKLICKALEENLLKRLDEYFQKRLRNREESLYRELSARVCVAGKVIYRISEKWRKRAEQLEEKKRKKEKILQAKEILWQYLEAERTEEIQDILLL